MKTFAEVVERYGAVLGLATEVVDRLKEALAAANELTMRQAEEIAALRVRVAEFEALQAIVDDQVAGIVGGRR